MTFYSWDEIDSVIDKFLGVKAKVLPFKLREGFEPDLKQLKFCPSNSEKDLNRI